MRPLRATLRAVSEPPVPYAGRHSFREDPRLDTAVVVVGSSLPVNGDGLTFKSGCCKRNEPWPVPRRSLVICASSCSRGPRES